MKYVDLLTFQNDRGWSRAEAAEFWGVPKSTYDRWVTDGDASPSPERRRDIFVKSEFVVNDFDGLGALVANAEKPADGVEDANVHGATVAEGAECVTDSSDENPSELAA